MKCENCGFMANPGDQVCMNCGAKLSLYASEENSSLKNNKKNNSLFVLLLVGGIILAIVLVVLFIKFVILKWYLWKIKY